MKKFLSLLVSLFFAALFTGCYGTADYMFDSRVGIVVKDADGNNLLDPNYEGNILENDITVEYKGEMFSVGVFGKESHLGLGIGTYDRDFKPMTALIFGDFYGNSTDLQEFVVNWGDGTSDKINFEYRVKWGWGVRSGNKHMEEAVEYKRIWLNDEFVSDSWLMVEIVK